MPRHPSFLLKIKIKQAFFTSLSLSFSPSFSLSLSLPPSFSLPLSLFLSHSLYLPLSLTLSLPPSFPLSPPLSVLICLPPSFSLSLSLWPVWGRESRKCGRAHAESVGVLSAFLIQSGSMIFILIMIIPCHLFITRLLCVHWHMHGQTLAYRTSLGPSLQL